MTHRWLLGALFTSLCAGQSPPVTVATSCGSSTGSGFSTPNNAISITIRAGVRESLPVTFTNSPQYPASQNTPARIQWAASAGSGSPPVFELGVAPFDQRDSVLALNFASGGASNVTLSVRYVLFGGEVSCSGSVVMVVTIAAQPAISSVNPSSFTLCGPDFVATVTGNGFDSRSLRVAYGYRGSTTDVQVLNATSTLVEIRLTRDLILRYPPTTSQGPVLIVYGGAAAGATPVSSAPYTAFTVRQTPWIETIVAAATPAGAFRVLTITGVNFVAETQLILTNGRGDIRLPVIQNRTSASFQAFLGEDTYQTAGPFLARVVNSESGNPLSAANVAGSYYLDSCSPPRPLAGGVVVGAPSSLTLTPSSATACGPGFSLGVTGANIVTTIGPPRLQVAGVTVVGSSFANGRFTTAIAASQAGPLAGSLTIAVANQTAPNQYSSNAEAALVIKAAPLLSNPEPAQLAPNGLAQTVVLATRNFTDQTRLALRRVGLGDFPVEILTRTANSVNVRIPGQATASATPATQLYAVNADEANPSGELPATGAGCPQPVVLPIVAFPGAAISRLEPAREFAGRLEPLTVSIEGTNFRAGARIFVGQDPAVAGELRSAQEMRVTLPASRFNNLGAVSIRVQNPDDVAPSLVSNFEVVAPRTPALVLSASPASPASPTEQPRLTLTQSNNSERPLNATITLSFEPDASTGVAAWPDTLPPFFAAPANSRTLSLTLPMQGNSVELPNLGLFRLPFVAGIVTARLTALTVPGTTVSVMPASAITATVNVRASAPVVETTVAPSFSQPANSTGYVIDFNAVSTPLNLNSIQLRFSVVPGASVDGDSSFTFDRANNAPLFDRMGAFFRQNLATGGQFRLQIPISVSSGEATSIQSVTIRLGNSAGESTETTIPRR